VLSGYHLPSELLSFILGALSEDLFLLPLLLKGGQAGRADGFVKRALRLESFTIEAYFLLSA
jgi:hypothetical protein